MASVMRAVVDLQPTTLLAGLVGGPLLFGLLARFSPGARCRNVIVVLAALFTAAAGLLVSFHGAFGVSLGRLSEPLALFADGGLLVLMLLIALRERVWAVLALILAQAGLLAVEQMGHPVAALSSDFIFDPLTMILVLVVSLVGSAIVVYAIGYMTEHVKHAPATAAGNARFFLVLLAFLGAMNGLVMANDLRWLTVFWEFTTLCSFLLIGHDGTPEARRNARRALIINTFGGTAMALAGFLAHRAGVHPSLGGIMAAKAVVPMAFLCLAALTKSAQIPFQSWLLGAMVAPTPVSALLHAATMVKAGSYLILRLAPAFGGEGIMTLITLAGAFTFAVAAALAVTQSNAKKVLAYSTISNLGLIVACAGLNTPLAYGAALMILCFHAVSKALLFLCVGTVEQRIGSRDIEDMGNLMFRMPVTASLAVIGMVSMLIPPFGMLISKWMAIEAAIGKPVPLILIILGSALTVLFWAKWIGRLQTASYHRRYHAERLHASMLGTMLLLTAGVIVTGYAAVPFYQRVLEGVCRAEFAHLAVPVRAWTLMDAPGGLLIWPAFILIGLALLIAIRRAATIDEAHVSMPFMCGENVAHDPAGEETGQPTYTFVGPMDKPVTAWTGTYYLRGIFDESAMTRWANLLGAMILLALFGRIGWIG